MNDRLRALHADITTLAVDAIVNAANSSLLGGGGVDGAIHRAAGPEMLHECRLLHGCKVGEVKVTGGHRLPGTLGDPHGGPVRGGGHGEAALLASCYRRSVEEALRVGARTLAFPAISTGIYGYPFGQAAQVAVATLREALAGEAARALDEVLLCCFSDADLRCAGGAGRRRQTG